MGRQHSEMFENFGDVRSLVNSDGAFGMVARDLKSDKGTGFTEIGNVQMLSNFRFRRRHDGRGKSGDGRIIDVNDDDGKTELVFANVNTEVGFDSSVPENVDEDIIEFDVSDAASLFQAIESFMQMTSARGSVFISGRLLHENCFFEFAVEVGTDDIDLMNFPVLRSGKS